MGDDFEGSLQVQRLAVGVATAISFTVPAYARWVLRSIQAMITQNATILIVIDDGTNEILRLDYRGASTNTVNLPHYENGNLMAGNALIGGFPLKAGWRVTVTYGANQDANAFVTIIYKEVGAAE